MSWQQNEIVHKSAYDKNSILFDVDVVNISEINKEAVLSYAAIHCGLTPEMIDTYTDYPSREEMARHLMTGINFLGVNLAISISIGLLIN